MAIGIAWLDGSRGGDAHNRPAVGWFFLVATAIAARPGSWSRPGKREMAAQTDRLAAAAHDAGRCWIARRGAGTTLLSYNITLPVVHEQLLSVRVGSRPCWIVRRRAGQKRARRYGAAIDSLARTTSAASSRVSRSRERLRRLNRRRYLRSYTNGSWRLCSAYTAASTRRNTAAWPRGLPVQDAIWGSGWTRVRVHACEWGVSSLEVNAAGRCKRCWATQASREGSQSQPDAGLQRGIAEKASMGVKGGDRAWIRPEPSGDGSPRI